MPIKEITIYTDGSSLGNPGKGGWGAVMIYQNNIKKISGNKNDATNNQMELTATIKSLEKVKEKCLINIYTDSNYVKNGITIWIHNWIKKNWRSSNNKAVKNQELWKSLYDLTQKHNISWNWIKAHNGDKYNEMADELARNAAEDLK